MPGSLLQPPTPTPASLLTSACERKGNLRKVGVRLGPVPRTGKGCWEVRHLGLKEVVV